MKKLNIFLVFLFITSALYAQKVKLEYDSETNEVTHNGEYYIMMVKSKGGMGGVAKNYSVQNRDGDGLIYFKFEARTNQRYNKEKRKYEDVTSYWYKISFPETGSFISLSKQITGMTEKGVMKFMSKNALIKDGELDWETTKQYLTDNGGVVKSPGYAGPSDTPVEIIDNEIFQDGVKIGKVVERSDETVRTFYVYDNNGTKVIEASIPVADPFEWHLIFPDGNEVNVMYEDDPNGIKILTYLATKEILKKLE